MTFHSNPVRPRERGLKQDMLPAIMGSRMTLVQAPFPGYHLCHCGKMRSIIRRRTCTPCLTDMHRSSLELPQGARERPSTRKAFPPTAVQLWSSKYQRIARKDHPSTAIKDKASGIISSSGAAARPEPHVGREP
jgi:hypothetical protein